MFVAAATVISRTSVLDLLLFFYESLKVVLGEWVSTNGWHLPTWKDVVQGCCVPQRICEETPNKSNEQNISAAGEVQRDLYQFMFELFLAKKDKLVGRKRPKLSLQIRRSRHAV